MHLRTLYRRSIEHHWRAALAVALGVAVGTAALTGALLVGDSMRGSLREAALDRLGEIDCALVASRYFREALAEEMTADDSPARICPAIFIRAGATHAESGASVLHVNLFGVDERFWNLDSRTNNVSPEPSTGRVVTLNQPLAEELRVSPGDEILLRIGKPSAISTETLLGRRDDTTVTLRLTVERVLPPDGLAVFSPNLQQTLPKNAFVPLKTLQRILRQQDRVNILLADSPTHVAVTELNDLFQRHTRLSDYGLQLRVDEKYGYVALESEAFLLEPPLEQAAQSATTAAAVLAYLANTIEVPERSAASIPYSTVVATDEPLELLPSSVDTVVLAPGEIILNEWAAHDLQAVPGDVLRLSYYVSAPRGQLHTEQATFRLRGIVSLAGSAGDPGLVPQYPGVTDTNHIADWDPPFPINLDRIRPRDEAYWDKYRATPKAFVSLTDGQRLWTEQSEHLGRLTSLRIRPRPTESLATTWTKFERTMLESVNPARIGLRFEAIRTRALAASAGTTDFGGLFIGFSLFLIISAMLLVALLFRLGIERRAGEVGLLLALGFPPRQVVRLLLGEGILIAGLGAAGGMLAARGYAWLMLAGLRSWWSGAVNTPFLRLHEAPASYFIGFGFSLLVAIVAMRWSLRGLIHQPTHALLAGTIQADRSAVQARWGTLSLVSCLLAVSLATLLTTLTLVTNVITQSIAFFCGGVAVLVACVSGLTYYLRREPRTTIHSTGRPALLQLGLRNARRHVGRSVLTAGLIASATFVITALQTMRLEPPEQAGAKDSGTGGFSLYAESAVPLPYDLNTPDGRAALNIPETAEEALAEVTFIPFRLRAGDQTSCLNLYRPTQPRLLGATEAMIARGGFTFSATLAESETERRNPWTLLQRQFSDQAIPVIADEAAALWQLHLGLGDDLPITDERGRTRALRIVALLRGSFLQDGLIVSEDNITSMFPANAGCAYFLIETPFEDAPAVERLLERELSSFGFAAASPRRHLAELFAIQNTYLSTFQTLGGLGLLLGTVGLAAVMLRNIWERRSELALLQALGFSPAALGWMVLLENGFLVTAGLLAGLLSAGLVVAPHVITQATPLPWLSLLIMFVSVFVTGMLAGLIALIPALRAPLLSALRSE